MHLELVFSSTSPRWWTENGKVHFLLCINRRDPFLGSDQAYLPPIVGAAYPSCNPLADSMLLLLLGLWLRK